MDVPVTELALARLEQLRAQYPRWHVWADDAGWHAMRRGSFLQRKAGGSAAHSLHVPDPVLLTAHLALEDAAETGADWRL